MSRAELRAYARENRCLQARWCLRVFLFLPETGASEGRIRAAAVQLGVPCITTLQAAEAAVKAMEALREEDMGVQALQDRFPKLPADDLTAQSPVRSVSVTRPVHSDNAFALSRLRAARTEPATRRSGERPISAAGGGIKGGRPCTPQCKSGAHRANGNRSRSLRTARAV